jgi:hypothetical protein
MDCRRRMQQFLVFACVAAAFLSPRGGLACVPTVEQEIVHGNVCCLQGWQTDKNPFEGWFGRVLTTI